MQHTALIIAIVLGFISVHASAMQENGNDNEDQSAELVLQPELQRRAIDLDKIDSGDFEAGLFVGILNIEDFGNDTVYGVRIAYHITEDFFVEVMGGKSDAGETSFERLTPSAPLITDDERELTYYNLAMGFNVFPGEVFVGSKYAFNSALYFVIGAGSTDFAGDDRFTINYGVGYRILFQDWLALHLDMRDHIFDIDLLGEEQTTHNLEFHTGITFFF